MQAWWTGKQKVGKFAGLGGSRDETTRGGGSASGAPHVFVRVSGLGMLAGAALPMTGKCGQAQAGVCCSRWLYFPSSWPLCVDLGRYPYRMTTRLDGRGRSAFGDLPMHRAYRSNLGLSPVRLDTPAGVANQYEGSICRRLHSVGHTANMHEPDFQLGVVEAVVGAVHRPQRLRKGL